MQTGLCPSTDSTQGNGALRAGLRLESHSRPMGRTSHHPSTDEKTDKAMALRSKGGKGSGGEPGAGQGTRNPHINTKGSPFLPQLNQLIREAYGRKRVQAQPLFKVHSARARRPSGRRAQRTLGKPQGGALKGPGNLLLSCLNFCLRNMHHHSTYFYHFPSPSVETRARSCSERSPQKLECFKAQQAFIRAAKLSGGPSLFL